MATEDTGGRSAGREGASLTISCGGGTGNTGDVGGQVAGIVWGYPGLTSKNVLTSIFFVDVKKIVDVKISVVRFPGRSKDWSVTINILLAGAGTYINILVPVTISEICCGRRRCRPPLAPTLRHLFQVVRAARPIDLARFGRGTSPALVSLERLLGVPGRE